MFFKLAQMVCDFLVEFENGESFHYDYGGPHSISVTLRHVQEGVPENCRRHDVLCEVTAQVDPDAEVVQVFEQLAFNESEYRHAIRRRFELALQKRRHMAESTMSTFDFYPEPFKEFVTTLEQELQECAQRIIRLMRWRHGIDGYHQTYASNNLTGFKWSLDGSVWKPVPTDLRFELTLSRRVPCIGEGARGALKALLEAHINNEPLDHELLREAWDQMNKSPRSALILAVAAAETGFKRCVSTLVPDASWLAAEVPSPPLDKMLKKYLPLLPSKGQSHGKLRLPKDILKTLQKGMQARNSTVHRGSSDLSRKKLLELLWAVRDTLSILDYYCGHEWALDNLRLETRTRLGLDKTYSSGPTP